MVKHHPSDNMLVEFSAGTLDWALSIVVSAHLQFCPRCKKQIAECNSVGGSMLESSKHAEVSSESFEKLMARIKATPDVEKQRSGDYGRGASRSEISGLPRVVQKLLPKDKALKWRHVSPSLKEAVLEAGQSDYEICFHKIKKGGRVAEHGHRGMEATLVLEGSFSDAEGNYAQGDFILKEPGEVHRPMAAQDQDCLCLSVAAAPVKVTGFMGKLVNPFLSINPR